MNPFAELLQSDSFSELDRQFARFLNSKAATPANEVELAAALASRSRSEGHVCFDLATAAGQLLTTRQRLPAATPSLPPIDRWRAALRTSGVVGHPGEFKPLVLDDADRLYLHRYWNYEVRLAAKIQLLAARELPAADPQEIDAALERHYPATAPFDPDQRRAAATALRRQFTVITGGPGTGKTRTIAVILSLLGELSPDRPLRVALAAPTGKAAARMQESIAALRESLPVNDAARRSFPDAAFTLHRLLRLQPGMATPHYYHDHPLPYDAVIVDEASMVDLALMAKLFDALGPNTRLLLAGDKDQLASVEAGAVLGDICHGLKLGESPGTKSPLAHCLVTLRTNHRFAQGHSIKNLRHALHDGDAHRARHVLEITDPNDPSLRHRTPPAPENIEPALHDSLLNWFQNILAASDPATALAQLSQFRILCALRVGPHGCDAVNRHAERLLARAALIPHGQTFYHGRPVLITRNDPTLGLSNGDVGLLLRSPEGGLRAWFSVGGTLRSFAPAGLPPHETTFAMTVHKAQGSEFNRVLLVLPDKWNAILTRELLYTGVTRARTEVELWTKPELLEQAVGTTSARASGLRAKLWGES